MIDDFWLNFKSSDFLFVVFKIKWHFQLMLSINLFGMVFIRDIFFDLAPGIQTIDLE